MNCNCAICNNNSPFDMPKEIVEAAVMLQWLRASLLYICQIQGKI